LLASVCDDQRLVFLTAHFAGALANGLRRNVPLVVLLGGQQIPGRGGWSSSLHPFLIAVTVVAVARAAGHVPGGLIGGWLGGGHNEDPQRERAQPIEPETRLGSQRVKRAQALLPDYEVVGSFDRW
jgi:hypothetical protein